MISLPARSRMVRRIAGGTFTRRVRHLFNERMPRRALMRDDPRVHERTGHERCATPELCVYTTRAWIHVEQNTCPHASERATRTEMTSRQSVKLHNAHLVSVNTGRISFDIHTRRAAKVHRRNALVTFVAHRGKIKIKNRHADAIFRIRASLCSLMIFHSEPDLRWHHDSESES